MQKGQTFEVEIDGVIKTAELLDIIEYKEENYAVYFTEKDEKTNDLYVSKVVKDSEGNDELVDTDDEEAKIYILEIIHELINKWGGKQWQMNNQKSNTL